MPSTLYILSCFYFVIYSGGWHRVFLECSTSRSYHIFTFTPNYSSIVLVETYEVKLHTRHSTLQRGILHKNTYHEYTFLGYSNRHI